MRTVRLEMEGGEPSGVSDASTGRRVPPPLLIDVRIAERGCDATATLSHLAPEGPPDAGGEPAVAVEEARVLIDRPAAALLFAMIRVRAGKPPPPPLSLTTSFALDASGRLRPDPLGARRRGPRGLLLGGGRELSKLLFAPDPAGDRPVP